MLPYGRKILCRSLEFGSHFQYFSNQITIYTTKKEPLYSDSFLFDMRGLIT